MPAMKSENQVTNLYHVNESDNYRQGTDVNNLLNNINKLELLKKRLNFMLTEIDLCINKS